MQIKQLILIISFFLSSWLIAAQEQEPSTIDSLKYDQSKLELKDFGGTLNNKYQEQVFNYKEDTGNTENFLRRAFRAVINKIEDLFGIQVDPGTYQLLETIIYIVLIVVGLYFMIRLLFGKQASSFFSGNSKTLVPLNVKEEDITQIDLETLITQALEQKDYRLAVRYMYLKVLKQLSFKELIQWHFEKTNSDYYREIKDPALKSDFTRVSYLYEHIWYGEFTLDNQGFNKAKAVFERINSKISSHG